MSVTLNFLDSLKGTYISHSAGHVSCNFHVHAHKDIGLTVCIQVVAGLPEPGPCCLPLFTQHRFNVQLVADLPR